MTNTDICNMALSYLGKGRIISMDDDTSEEARQCRIHYDHCRRMLLGKYTWSFAKRVTELALCAKTVPGWDYCYGYPGKCLAVRFIFDKDLRRVVNGKKNAFEVAMLADNQKVIMTDLENAWCEFTQDTVEVDLFSEEFIEALAHYLAASMALSLDGNAAIQQTQMQLYQIAFEAAKVGTANERENLPTFPEDYSNARFAD